MPVCHYDKKELRRYGKVSDMQRLFTSVWEALANELNATMSFSLGCVHPQP
jgi:hypothetical protein